MDSNDESTAASSNSGDNAIDDTNLTHADDAFDDDEEEEKEKVENHASQGKTLVKDDDDDDDDDDEDEEADNMNDKRDGNASVDEKEDDDVTVKSNVSGDEDDEGEEEDATSVGSSASTTHTSITNKSPVKRGRKRRSPFSNVSRKGRTPSVKGLTIPFRTVKKAMKLDPDIPIVQNEAAIMATFAVELFLQKLSKDSFKNARFRGRNTVRYEDVAEARTASPKLIFLETLLP